MVFVTEADIRKAYQDFHNYLTYSGIPDILAKFREGTDILPDDLVSLMAEIRRKLGVSNQEWNSYFEDVYSEDTLILALNSYIDTLKYKKIIFANITLNISYTDDNANKYSPFVVCFPVGTIFDHADTVLNNILDGDSYQSNLNQIIGNRIEINVVITPEPDSDCD